MQTDDLIVGLKAGDLLLFSRPCTQMDFISAGICFGAKFLGWTEWDHLGLVVENPETNELFLLEANVGGITMHPLTERIKRTKSPKLSVRKLTIQVNHAAPEEVILQEFRSKLWSISQSYKDKSYNKSLFNMADALINSYTHNFFAKLLKLKHERLVLKENEYMIQNLLSQEQNNSFLGSLMQIYLRSLKFKLEKIQGELLLLEKTSPTARENIPLEKDPQSEAYYCSQLVAEIFMEMNILSKHRLSYQYIPADFSSSTVMKGLVTHSCDSLVSDDETQDALSSSKSHKYLYSPDILIPDKNLLKFSVNQSHVKMPTPSTFFTELVLEYPIFPSTKKGNSSDFIYEIPFHTSDVLSLSILKSFLENTKNRLRVAVNGELRIYRIPRRMKPNSIFPYEFVGILNPSICNQLDVAEYLKLLYHDFHQDYYLYLSAISHSSLSIQSISNNLFENANDKKKFYDYLQERELLKTLFNEILKPVLPGSSLPINSNQQNVNILGEGLANVLGKEIKYSSQVLQGYVSGFSTDFADLISVMSRDVSVEKDELCDLFILFFYYLKAVEGEPASLSREIRSRYPSFFLEHSASLSKKIAAIPGFQERKNRDQDYRSLSLPFTAASVVSAIKFRRNGPLHINFFLPYQCREFKSSRAKLIASAFVGSFIWSQVSIQQ